MSQNEEVFKSLIISDEIIINKEYILKSLKYYIYILILNNYENNKAIYYNLLNDLINKLFIITTKEEIYKFMFNTVNLYKNFINKSKNDMSLEEQDYTNFDKYFRILLHCIFWTNYIQADNMYALSCIQVFVLLFDNEKLNIFNYINLIFHLSCDLTKIYDNIRINNNTDISSPPPSPPYLPHPHPSDDTNNSVVISSVLTHSNTRDVGNAGGGVQEDNIKLVANIYSNILNIDPSMTEQSDYKFINYINTVKNDCSYEKVSDSYIKAILNLHKNPILLDNINELNNLIALQINLLLTIDINKCALYNFIDYCIKNKDKKIYILNREIKK